MSSKKAFDPNAIPNYGGAGRVGELDPNEPEEQMSSAQVPGADPEARTDPAAGEVPADSGDARMALGDGAGHRMRDPAGEALPASPGRQAAAPRQPLPREERPRTLRDDRARGQTHNPTDNPEPLTQGAGGIDGLVGAP